MPQPPQLLGSVLVFTQVPLQSFSPVAQFWLQTPMSHRLPAPQTLPHCPQLLGSLSVLVQTPPHSCSPPGQVQVAERQISLALHALEQLPQCWGSVCSSTQLFPHCV
jgi:hypothetical protein